jgi:hypothetical protein
MYGGCVCVAWLARCGVKRVRLNFAAVGRSFENPDADVIVSSVERAGFRQQRIEDRLVRIGKHATSEI